LVLVVHFRHHEGGRVVVEFPEHVDEHDVRGRVELRGDEVVGPMYRGARVRETRRQSLRLKELGWYRLDSKVWWMARVW
jgi:hypothetical protein